MKTQNKVRIFFASFLILLGIIILILNVIPGIDKGKSWPLIFFVIGAAFFTPSVLFPEAKSGLAALFIPGSLFCAMGLIFVYNVLSGDWVSWGYSWLLMISGVGMGLMLASRAGGWGRVSTLTGIWLAFSTLLLFGIFAAIFGGTLFKMIWPVVLILGGGYLVLRSIKKKP